MQSYSKPFNRHMTRKRAWTMTIGVALLFTAIGYTAVALQAAGGATKYTNEIAQPVPELSKDTPPSINKNNDTTLEATIESDMSAPLNAELKVNGQSIPLPESGSLHETFQDGNSTTKLDVSVDNQSSGSTSIDSSTSIDLNIQSEAEVEVNNTE